MGDDNDISKDEWVAYCLYLDYILYYSYKMKGLREFALNDDEDKIAN